jgi:hypothetical protein
MSRVILQACLPWMAGLFGSCLLAYLLVRASRARWQFGRVWRLHRDQAGAVQSLSFVLTLPVFIYVMMLIVQISQMMIGIIVVHYAAFAAARSAVVWIPADLAVLDSTEGPNCLSSYQPDPDADPKNQFPTIPHTVTVLVNGQLITIPNVGDGPPPFGLPGGVTYLVNDPLQTGVRSTKYEKIRTAAVMALMPVSPSHDYGFSVPASPPASVIQDVYGSMSPGSASNAAVPRRLQNKFSSSKFKKLI